MQLDERKWKILQAIIKTYLETGEPVGSRTISKYADLNLSSATIRNEMADLEELGYIIQPHTSAGRIPSDLGYRLYVNHLMEEKEQQVTEMKELMIEKQDKMEMVLKRVAQFLAANTNYASMITGPQYHRTKLKFIQLSIVSEDQLLAVVVTEGNVVKNKMISLHHGLDQETVLKLNILLNTSLNGLTMDQINLTTIAKIKEEAGIHSEVVNSVLDAVAEAIQMDEEEMEIYTSGATNIFKYPELSDSEKASSLIGTFEEKKQLADLVADTMADDKNTGIQVYIGNETPVQTMKDCSVVTATYELGDGMRGTIGIIGPKRMDYDRVVGTLKTLTTQLDDIFGKKKEEQKQPCCCGGSCTPEAMQAAEAEKKESGIKILGGGCAKCNALEAATVDALRELGMDTTIDHVRDFEKIAAYGVMTTPALVVDGQVVSYGKVLKKDEVIVILKKVRA